MKYKWILVLWLWPLFGQAATLTMQINNKDGTPLPQAVVTVYPEGAQHAAPAAEAIPMLQKDKKFSPDLLVVQQGSVVQFKNDDSIRHHVFSFSPVQQLDLDLRKQQSSDPIRLEKSGVITLGCNIHDWMQAHLLVTDSAFFAVSDPEGRLSIAVPDSAQYDLTIWHPALPAGQKVAELRLSAAELKQVQFSFPVQIKLQDELDIDELGQYEE